MATAPQVSIVGMRALRRDISKMTADAGPLYAALRAAGRTAAEPVAAVTRSALPQVSGHLAGDVRVTATKSGAGVRMGRASLRYAPWIEFGGRRKTPHESFRAYDPRGRYLFPSAIQLQAVSARLYANAVQNALDHFQWTNETADPGGVHD
jgi:hypothetical protein